MTKINKKHLKVGALIGAGALGIYFLTRPSDVGEASFGGGFGGELPAGEVMESKKDSATGDIIYQIGQEAPFGPIDWGIDAQQTDAQKAVAVIEKAEAATAPLYAITEKSARLGAPTAADVAAYGATQKDAIATETGRTQESVATGDILNWNFQDAANNVGLWLLGAERPSSKTISRYSEQGGLPKDVSKTKTVSAMKAAATKKHFLTKSSVYGRSVVYGRGGRSYNVPGVKYGKGGITYSSPAGPPAPKKKNTSRPGSPD